VEFQVLGPLQVSVGGQPVAIGNARKRRIVLAALLARAGRPVPTDTLIAAVWGERPPASARPNLQLYVHQLRRALDDKLICAHGDGYTMDPGEGLDAARFRRLAAAGAGSLAGDPATAVTTLRAALDLWRGPAFGEFLDCELVREEAQRLEMLRLDTYERWAEAQLATGATPALAAELAELCRLHPYRESLRGHLMRALYQNGRQAEALAVFRETRSLLVDQLGVEPGEALRQLHQQILSADPAASAPAAPPGSPAVPRQLPAPPQVFTGRVRELAALEQLPDASTVVISAIDGMAGIGKTALALHAAHRIAGRFPDGQLFIDLHGYTQGVEPVEPGEALDRLLRALGIPGQRIPAGLDERAALYRTRLADRQVLIVLDNAATEGQVVPLLPGAPGCLVLVTSRRRLAGLDGTRTVSLDTLSTADALALFASTAGEQRVADRTLLPELVELCGRLPLAIRIAAARLRSRPSWSLADLVERLRDQQHRLGELAAGQRSVTAALDLSHQHLNRDLQHAYRLLGLHAGPEIDRYAAAALFESTVPHAGRMLDELLDAHLLLEPVAGRYRFHDLVRAHAAALSGAEPTRDAALDRLLDYYRHTASAAMDTAYPYERDRRPRVPPAITPVPELPGPAAALGWLDTELSNLLAAARFAVEHGHAAHALHLSSTLHWHLFTRGHFDETETLHLRALATARATGDRAGELDTLTGLGHVHRLQGRHEQAAGDYRSALRIARAAGNRAGELDALIGLGRVDVMQGRHERAIDRLEQALRMARATGDAIGERNALASLGDLHARQGRYEQATDHLGQALRIASATGDSSGEQYALARLGYLHRLQGRYEQAIDHLEQALRIARGTGNRIGEQAALAGLGYIHWHQGRYEQATDHLEQALRSAHAIGDRVGELTALNGLGQVHRRQGRYEPATGYYRRLLELAQESGDRNFQFEAWQGLGRLRHATGDPDAAVAHHGRALALADELDQPIDRVRAHDGLGHAYHVLARHEQARKHWQHALDALTGLGIEHTDDEEASLAAISSALAGLRGRINASGAAGAGPRRPQRAQGGSRAPGSPGRA
jgi:DNA-binding SARP family transcriptional activator/Tfp pilus assembly protein PilF